MQNTYNTSTYVYVFDLEKLKISNVVILKVLCPGLSEKIYYNNLLIHKVASINVTSTWLLKALPTCTSVHLSGNLQHSYIIYSLSELEQTTT